MRLSSDGAGGPRRRPFRWIVLRAATGLLLTAVTIHHPEAAYLGPLARAVIQIAAGRPGL